MLHLDQHSALPPESIMGCDNTPHFFISWRMMQLLLVAAADGGDYDELGSSKVEGEPFIEV